MSAKVDAIELAALPNQEVHVEVQSNNGWKAYFDSKYDSPVLNRFVPFPTYYYIRWKLLAFFHIQLLFGIVAGEVIVFLILVGGLAGWLAAVGMSTTTTNVTIAINQTKGRQSSPTKGLAEETGNIAAIPLILCFALACRNSLWILLAGVPFERGLFWHKLCAWLGVLVGAWHGYVSQEWNVTGLVLTGAMGGLILFAFYPLRRYFFEAFYRFHWILFLVVIGFSVAHGAGVVLIGVGLWLFDVILRIIIAFINNKRARKLKATRLPAGVIRLSFPKNNFKYKAGQYCFICVPGVSLIEWHPFSISSSSHEPNVTLHIRILGDWTKKLYSSIEQTRDLLTYVDGPYGAPGVDIDSDKYKLVMFFSGGIGITPAQSICNEMLYQYKIGRPLHKIIFVWSVRDLFLVDSVLEYDKENITNKSVHRLPISFQPDLVNQPDVSEKILENYFHLTQERDKSKFEEANIKPDLQQDLRFGRPIISEYFEKMTKFALMDQQYKIAVITCGPSSMVNDVEKMCYKYSTKGLSFHLHKEVFEF
ncbi:LOW QUALITY PROTEIN: superoxide-generating NADPH oxidase heavy chain subunit A-like [Hydra vulgaris]|uniref:LOW QUALITY PROTEIN: superoxide-generating NADPH oxidase heavy chain subunit A-like n=1 Tax=Hydra vulgaris TaxID=6087 RepID=A0ABM4DJM8_HYDVU